MNTAIANIIVGVFGGSFSVAIIQAILGRKKSAAQTKSIDIQAAEKANKIAIDLMSELEEEMARMRRKQKEDAKEHNQQLEVHRAKYVELHAAHEQTKQDLYEAQTSLYGLTVQLKEIARQTERIRAAVFADDASIPKLRAMLGPPPNGDHPQ